MDSEVLAKGFGSIPDDFRFFLLVPKNKVVAIVPTITQRNNKVDSSILVQHTHDILNPINAARVIPYKKLVIKTTTYNKNGSSIWTVFEGVDEGFYTRTAPREIHSKVLTNRGNFCIRRKDLMSHTPSEDTNFWEGFELPYCFLEESVRVEPHLLEKEPRVCRLGSVETVRVVKPSFCRSGH